MPSFSAPVLPPSSAVPRPRSGQTERGYTPDRDLSVNHDKSRELPVGVSVSTPPTNEFPALPSRGGLAALL